VERDLLYVRGAVPGNKGISTIAEMLFYFFSPSFLALLRSLTTILPSTPHPSLTLGGFLRVVDAVKGPFYPSPPPFPTFTSSQLADLLASGVKEVVAPPLSTDPLKLVEPVNQIA